MYEARNSIYCYEGTNTLVNKLDIKDSKLLEEYEKTTVALKLLSLEKQGIIGNFDITHFSNIHRFLFGEIYLFAGLFRTENIAKDNFRFAEWEYIESELNKLLDNLKSENYLQNLDKQTLAERLAYYTAELNVLHPFREGNGRTTREFIRQLALKNNYYLNFNSVSSTELLNASIKSVIDTTDLANIIFKCLEDIKN